MDYRFRRATPDQFEEVRRIWSVVYQRGENYDQEAPKPGDAWYIAHHEGRAVWAAEVGRGEVVLGPRRAKVGCGCVAMVGTLPEARGLGVANRAMEDLNRAMREEGYPLAALYPYRESFYARSGYARCGWRWQIKAPRDRMPRLKAPLRVVELPPDKITEVAACYEAMIGGINGCLSRSPEAWRHRLGRKPEAIYAAYGPSGVEGYFWARPSEFWGWLNIGELGWSTMAGYESCLAVMRGMAENQEGLTWAEPPVSPFLHRFIDQGIEASRSRATMFRVLDVAACLKAVPHRGAPYSFRLADSVCTENAGVWTCGDGEVTQGGEAEFGLEISAFTQAFMGSPSVSALDDTAPAGMAEHLPPGQVCCMDFF